MDYTRDTKFSSRKKNLKEKKDSSELADRELLWQKCNEVRKAAKADKAKWLQSQCEDIDKYYGEYKTRKVNKMICDNNRK